MSHEELPVQPTIADCARGLGRRLGNIVIDIFARTAPIPVSADPASIPVKDLGSQYTDDGLAELNAYLQAHS